MSVPLFSVTATMPRATQRTSSKTKQPFVKVLFSPRLGKPWLGGVGTTESMWVLKVAGGDLKGSGLLANQPLLLPYIQFGDVVLYASGNRDVKPEALVVERHKFKIELAVVRDSQPSAWAALVKKARPQCKGLLKRLRSGEFKLTLARINAHVQRVLGCVICGFRDQWWMTTNKKWASVPRRYRKRVLCRKCFTDLTRLKP